MIWIYNFKKHNKKVLSDVYSILTLFVLFAVYILYPIFFSFIDSILCERNMLHFTSIIFGVIFLFFWRKRFSDVLKSVGEDNFQKIKPSIWDRLSRILAYVVTILNLLILLVVLIFFD